MADPPAAERPAGAVRDEAALTTRYEQLRRIALAGHAEGWRHGLGVLATRGVTGWMNACQRIAPSPTPAPPQRASVDALGPDARELVGVMAAMALAHL